MAAIEAVNFIMDDHGRDPGQGFRGEFARDDPYRSLLQRQDKTLEEVLDIFEWKSDDARWLAENERPKNDTWKLMRYKRRVSFCITGWRDLKEDFGRGDVSCLRDIRTPLVTSRTPLKAAYDEFDGGE